MRLFRSHAGGDSEHSNALSIQRTEKRFARRRMAISLSTYLKGNGSYTLVDGCNVARHVAGRTNAVVRDS